MKVLVVDDDVVSRMALVDLVSSLPGLEPVEAEDGEQAWEYLESGVRPILCCCDVRMPNLSGIDLLQRLRLFAGFSEMPFVLVSSASDRDTVMQAIKLGAVDYILKPFAVADVRLHLERIVKTVWSKMAETPATTLRRLNIGSERLVAYLGAFQNQLRHASQELAQLLAQGNDTAARAKLDALHTGCVTLGLGYAAGLIDTLRQAPLVAREVSVCLEEVARVAAYQSGLVKGC